MFKTIATVVAIVAVATLGITIGMGSASAQEKAPSIPDAMQVKKLPRQKLAGPRFGFTVFTGEVAEYQE